MKSRLLFIPALAATALAEPPVYERHIAPVLRTYCAGCHNDADMESDFSVETFIALQKGGSEHGAPLKPGDADGSLLVKVIAGTAKPKMPPKDEPQLPAEELALLKKWIAAGAPGPAKDTSILRQLIVPKLPASKKAEAITAAAYSRDGSLLALARQTAVEIRDAATGALRATITDLPGRANALHFSPDNARLLIATGITGLLGTAQLRDSATGALAREFGGAADTLYDAEFSPDGSLIATAGYDRVVRIYERATAKLLRSVDGHKGAVFDVAFDPTGKILATASADETVKLWRLADGERLDTLNQPQGEQIAVAFTPDGAHVVAAGADKRVHMWRLVSREKPALNPLIASRFAHDAAIAGFAMSADGKFLLTTAVDRGAKLWSLPALELAHVFNPQPDVAPVLAAVPGTQRFLVARMDGSMDEFAAVPAEKPATPTQQPIIAQATSPAAALEKATEAEPNDTTAQLVKSPAEITGSLATPGDRDLFRFTATAGEALVLETNAARSKSKADTRIEVLHANGKPVEQVVLQATRDSWFTFRGKDYDTSDDFRVHNWAQMELNEFLYASGEVVKLWLYPRGPDSGFKAYPGDGRRHTFFGTTPLAHALGAPAYIVRPLPPGTTPAPNGLPVFHLNYENDDDPQRRAGSDSVLHFTAPATGEYVARVTDTRGFGAKDGHHYTLTIRPRRPDFKITIGGANPKVSPASGREFSLKAERFDGFDGPIRVDIAGLPAGFNASTPIIIESGQASAEGVLFAEPGAANPDDAADKAVKLTATAEINGAEIRHDLGGLGNIEAGPAAKVTVEILPGEDRSIVRATPGGPLEFTVRRGTTIAAKVRAVRHDFAGRIEVGRDDAGRNLPHGAFVDNVGLNGLLIVEGQTEREFFITASPVTAPGRRLFHLKASADGGQCSRPAWVVVE